MVVGTVALMTLLWGDDWQAVEIALGLSAIAMYGAAVGRWWAVMMPAVWGGLYLGVLRIVDLATGACSVCGSDEDWGNFPMFFLVILVLPVTLAVLVGVTAAKTGRALRRGVT